MGAGIVLAQVTNATVVVETTNAEPASVVLLCASPRANGRYTATVTQVVSEAPLVIRWTGNQFRAATPPFRLELSVPDFVAAPR